MKLTGVSIDEVKSVFTGHFAGGFDIATAVAASQRGSAAMSWLLMASVGDATKTDALTLKLASLIASVGRRVEHRQAMVAGIKMHVLTKGDTNVAIGRHESVLLLGSGEAALAAAARAIGDLNCDGVLSTFERVGHIDDENNVNGGAGLFKENEFE